MLFPVTIAFIVWIAAHKRFAVYYDLATVASEPVVSGQAPKAGTP